MAGSYLKKYSGFICAALAVIAAILLRQIGFRTVGLTERFCTILRPLIYIVMFSIWGVSVRRRIIQPQVRRYLTAISVLIVFWMAVRTIRFLFVDSPGVLRLFWYMYYIPMLFIPLLAVFVAMSLGKPESFRMPRWTALIYIPAFALSLLVLTNDLHQLVFAFPADAVVWENDYRYAFGYFLVVGFQLLCALFALTAMLIKCRIPDSRRILLLPLAPVTMALIYGVLYILRAPWLRTLFGDVTAVFCLFITAALESCIQCGLIQTNTGYEKLFETGTIGAQIADAEHNVLYTSSNAAPLSKELMLAAESGSAGIDKDTLLKSSPISGGHVLWQEDIADITALLERLEENRKTLEDSNCIEEENYRTKVKINALREKNRLYDQLQKQTAGQIDLLDRLLNRYETETDPAVARSLLAKIGVIGAYIKRRGNLIFISEKAEQTDTAELAACLAESFAALEFMDIECALDIPSGQTIPVSGAARVYDLFEAAVEAALDDLSSMWLKSRVLGGAVVFCMEVESRAELSRLAEPADSCVLEDGVWRFTLRIGKAGETA